MVGYWTATGPISLQGAPQQQPTNTPALGLLVVGRPGGAAAAAVGRPAAAHPSALAALRGDVSSDSSSSSSSTSCLVTLADGSDCVLTLRADEAVKPGCIVFDDVQQFNLHMLAGDTHKFRLFEEPDSDPFELVDVSAEVRLLPNQSAASHCDVGEAGGVVQVDAGELAAALMRQHFGRVLAVNELLAVSLHGHTLLVRITTTHTLSEAERDDAIGYHCFRGRLCPSTALYLSARDDDGDSSSGAGDGATANGADGRNGPAASSDGDGAAPAAADTADAAARATSALMAQMMLGGGGGSGGAAHVGCARMRLGNVRERESRPPATDVVGVTTSDGEWFPVKKKLLRACIALTKVVRDSGDTAAAVTIDVDCLTFDRALLFLEANLLGKPPPQWSLHHVEPLAAAASALSCRPLAEYCQSRLGQMAQGVRIHRFDDVVAANASGELWLVLDSMVLDVKAWLPEHPGGASIIPRQSLNVDCARFFEMYHASRESFLYLRDFYLGEIHPEDRAIVPQGGEDKLHGRAAQPPGEDFLAQLREFTEGWRLRLGPKGDVLHAAYADVKTHLGAH
ncbi:hypothetical protein FOA52_012478 [Chlamydomonas sp. UWO 241]|nr:hypothetical protein FOA52_012478 [Chlamydomonas sp. UWO 241]